MIPNSHMIRVFGGSTVLLTGAASGIGRALALLLSKCGATVHALDLNEEGLDSLVSEAAAIHPHCVDITNYEAYSASCYCSRGSARYGHFQSCQHRIRYRK